MIFRVGTLSRKYLVYKKEKTSFIKQLVKKTRASSEDRIIARRNVYERIDYDDTPWGLLLRDARIRDPTTREGMTSGTVLYIT